MVCVHVCVRACVCVRHICIWACLLIFHACGGQRLMTGVFLCCFLVLFVLSQKLSLNLELTVSATLAVQWTAELACVHPYPALGLQLCAPCPASLWVLGIWTQGLVLTQQALHPPSHCRSPPEVNIIIIHFVQTGKLKLQDVKAFPRPKCHLMFSFCGAQSCFWNNWKIPLIMVISPGKSHCWINNVELYFKVLYE